MKVTKKGYEFENPSGIFYVLSIRLDGFNAFYIINFDDDEDEREPLTGFVCIFAGPFSEYDDAYLVLTKAILTFNFE